MKAISKLFKSYGDLGTNKSLFFSPRTYKEILQPWEKKLVETYHKKGVRVFRPCHGNINLIFKEVVNNGYDSIDPLDPFEKIDLAEVKEKYGDKITFLAAFPRTLGDMTGSRSMSMY